MGLVRWDYALGEAGNVRTRRNYVPASETGLKAGRSSKPSKEIGNKEKSSRSLRVRAKHLRDLEQGQRQRLMLLR